MMLDVLDLHPLALAPAGVHPHQHLGPVLALRAAGAGIDFDIGVVGVGLSGKQRRRLVAISALGELREAADRVIDQGSVAFGLGKLDQLRGVGKLALKSPRSSDRFLQPTPFTHHVLRCLGMVPQRRILDLVIELLQALVRPVPIEEPAQQRGRGIDLVDMGLRFSAHGQALSKKASLDGTIRARSGLASRRRAAPPADRWWAAEPRQIQRHWNSGWRVAAAAAIAVAATRRAPVAASPYYRDPQSSYARSAVPLSGAGTPPR